MASNFKDFMTKPLPRKDSGQAMIFCVGGGYMVYMAIDMLIAAYKGEFDISITTAWVVSGLMLVAGLFVLGYAARLWFAHKRATDEENARLLAERLAREAAEAAALEESEEPEEE